MKKKKLTWMAALCLAAACTAAGCGSTASETTGASEAESGTEAEASEETETASGEETGEETTQAGTVDPSEIEAIEVLRPDSLGTAKLGKYEGVAITAPEPYTVTEVDVDSYIQYYVLPSYIASVDDAAQLGDTVNIDYVGTKDGVAFDGGSAEGTDLELGSGRFIDGFEDGLVGHKKGEEVSLDLTFPEDYFNEDLAGAEVVFDVTINDVKRVPELTDGLAAEIDPNSTTAEEYVENVRAMLQENEDFTEHQNLSYLAISAVVEDSEVEPSEEAVEWKISDLIVNYYEPMLNQSYGFGLAEMLSMQAVTLEEFRDQLREAATQEVSQLLVADEIAKEQNLTVGEQELEDFAARYHMTLQDMLTNYSQEELDALVKEQLAMDYIVEHAEITYADEEETAEEETLAEETAEAE